MANKNKQNNHATGSSRSNSSFQKELSAISYTGYASKGEETQRRIKKVQQALAEARKELILK